MMLEVLSNAITAVVLPMMMDQGKGIDFFEWKNKIRNLCVLKFISRRGFGNGSREAEQDGARKGHTEEAKLPEMQQRAKCS